MKKFFSIVLALSLIPMAFGFQMPSATQTQPHAITDYQALLPHPFSKAQAIIASQNEIFVEKKQNHWQTFWHLPSLNQKINHLISFPQIPDSIFVLTDDGAFRGDIETQKWQKIYQGVSKREQQVLSFAVLTEDSEHWFIGTQSGLFESDDAGKTWYRFDFFRRQPISKVLYFKQRLYVATHRHVYVSDDLTYFHRTFGLESLENETITFDEEEMVESDDADESTTDSSIHSILAVEDPAETLFIATRRGVYQQRGNADFWIPLPTTGLTSTDIRHLLIAPQSQQLFAGTPRGVFLYRAAQKKWEALYAGFAEQNIRGLAILEKDQEYLAAITANHYVLQPINPEFQTPFSIPLPSPENLSHFQQLTQLEPSAIEVHRDIIRYANLSNGKIKRWHIASKLKAVLPNASFGKDFSRSNNLDIDRGGSADPDLYISGPDDINRGWDFDVSWDLGDFIWSSAQTSIDSREKIMVEYRNDLLAEATRLYYERRRLQMDFVMNPPQSEIDHFDRLSRIEELTAILDSLTNGRFSKRLLKIYADHPLLSNLWRFETQNENPDTHRNS